VIGGLGNQKEKERRLFRAWIRRGTSDSFFNGNGWLDAIAINLIFKRRKKRGLQGRPIFTETGKFEDF